VTNKIFQGTFIILATIILAQPATAANLQVSVVDFRQIPIDFAVVYVNESMPALTGEATAVDQVDKEFIPYVTAIQRGGSINFLNNDNIRHQVYSFSKVKQFEIPLFKGNPLRPVSFDMAGPVPIACNIHDWMSAYVYVVDTDKFAVTDTFGGGAIANLPNGEYEVLVWHPKMEGSAESSMQKVTINGGDQNLTFTITQKPLMRAWRAPRNAVRRNY
jgi:plastocyanin